MNFISKIVIEIVISNCQHCKLWAQSCINTPNISMSFCKERLNKYIYWNKNSAIFNQKEKLDCPVPGAVAPMMAIVTIIV